MAENNKISKLRKIFVEEIEKLKNDKEYFKELVDFSMKFKNYRFYESVLIHRQNPKAMDVRTSREWNEKGLYLLTSAKGIQLPNIKVYDISEIRNVDMQKIDKTEHIWNSDNTINDIDFERIKNMSPAKINAVAEIIKEKIYREDENGKIHTRNRIENGIWRNSREQSLGLDGESSEEIASKISSVVNSGNRDEMDEIYLQQPLQLVLPLHQGGHDGQRSTESERGILQASNSSNSTHDKEYDSRRDSINGRYADIADKRTGNEGHSISTTNGRTNSSGKVGVGNSTIVQTRIGFDTNTVESKEEVDNTSSFYLQVSKQENIDKIICCGSGFQNGKYRIYNFLKDSRNLKENIQFLKNEYGVGGRSVTDIEDVSFVSFDSKGITLSRYETGEKQLFNWTYVSQRTVELIEKDEYLTELEKEYLQIYLQELDEKNNEILTEKERFFYDNSNPNELITEEMLERLPKLYSQDGIEPHKQTVHAAYIIPFKSNWTWYMTEYDKDTNIAFGLVAGDFAEWGYFSIDELEELNAQRLVLEDFPKTFEEIRDTELIKQFTEKEIHSIFKGKLDSELKTEQQEKSEYEIADEKLKRETLIGKSFEKDGKKYIINSFKEDKILLDEEITDPTEKIIFSGGKHLEEFISDYSKVLDNLLEKEKLKNNTEVEQTEQFVDHFYVVEDIKKQGTLDIKTFSTLIDAWQAYQSLSSDKVKALGIQNTKPMPGSLDFIQCVDGKDMLINDYTTIDDWNNNSQIKNIVTQLEELINNAVNIVEHNQTAKAKYIREEDQTLKINNSNEQKNVLNGKAEPFILTEEVIPSGKRNKFEANLKAIQLLKDIEKENRYATEEEKIILSQYSGFGGIQEAFDNKLDDWQKEYIQLKELLTDEEYEQARASTLNAHYTPKEVIDCIYETLQRLGFEGGNVLDPCCGVCKFYSYMPKEMQEKSKLDAVEIDSITGRIAKQLHQRANLQITGYQSIAYKDNYYDLIVSNVPFGEYKISDKRNKGYIHDFFFLKSLEQVKPGGIVAFITSTGTLDKQNPAIRKKIAQRAELIGAVRLPDNTFAQTANTRGVTSDVIFLQKRTEPCYEEPNWVYTGIYQNDGDEDAIINQYFVDNPQNMLGELKMVSSRFGRKVPTIKETSELSLKEKFLNATKSMIIQQVDSEKTYEKQSDVKYIPADEKVKNFTFTVVNNEIYYRENDIMLLKTFNSKDSERIKLLCALKESYKQVRDYQLNNEFSSEEFNKLLEDLNQRYDVFYNKFGAISIPKNIKVFRDDREYPIVESLEKVIVDEDDNKTYVKSDMFFKPTINRKIKGIEFNTAEDILNYTIAEKGNVDIEYMTTLTEKSKEQLIEELYPFIFEEPKTYNTAKWKEVYISKEEYLSGNVREKLEEVKKLDEIYPDIFEKHIQALEMVQPTPLTATDIEVRLSAHWIDKKYINQFMYELLDIPYYYQGNTHSDIYASYSNISNEWKINGKTKYSNIATTKIYGTQRASALLLIEQTLNQKIIRITDPYEEDGKTKSKYNHEETVAARAKQDLINEKFKDWIFEDLERRTELVERYNVLFNSTVPRQYDGSHIQLTNSNTDIKLRPHQLNAVSRMRTGNNTLLAHVVGAGKTYTMIAGAMEQIRLGVANKVMFVVPNHLLRDFAGEYLNLYPTANIIVPTEKDFEKANRQRFISKIVTSDIDAVILGHSQFERISISPKRKEIELRRELTDLEHAIASAETERGNSMTVKQLENKKEKLKEKIEELLNSQTKDEQIYFEELGCDSLIVDEAHAFKNGAIFSKMKNVSGISNSNSLKASDMLAKCRYINEIGGTITFATGTPISNSISELYVMQRYLQEDTLNSLNIHHFDEWISNFGQPTSEVELKPEGSGYRPVTRISKYYNLPELMAMFNEVADIQTKEMLNLPTPKLTTGSSQVIACEPSEELLYFMDEVVERSENIRNSLVEPYEDNMLKVSSDARKAGTDMRLYDENSAFDENGKLSICADKVYKLYKEHMEEKATQLIFSDIGVPSSKFNVYDELKRLLVEKGIPDNEIAFMHDYETQIKKKELFSDMRSGIKRVLIGSTDKCGAGTNIQDRLIALHHIDCPWKPSSVEQREGRILRQGNMFEEVSVFRYVTKRSFDAYMWQLLERKQKFISQIMNGNSAVRNCEDVDDAALSYAEVKTIATGNPLIKEKHDVETKINQLSVLEKAYQKEKYAAQEKIISLPKKIETEKKNLSEIKMDAEMVSSYENFSVTLNGVNYTERAEAGKNILSLFSGPLKQDEITEIGEFRGFKIGAKYELTSIGRTRMMYLYNNHKYKAQISESGLGCITRLENLYNKQISFELNQSSNKITEYTKEMEQLNDVLKNDFSQKDELIRLKQRLVEINMEIDNEANARRNDILEISENKLIETKMDNGYGY